MQEADFLRLDEGVAGHEEDDLVGSQESLGLRLRLLLMGI